MYRIVPDPAVDEQITALPRTALLAYAEVLGLLELAPHSGRPYNATLPDGPMRQHVFGARGEGILTYLVLDGEREVHLQQIDWIGDVGA